MKWLIIFPDSWIAYAPSCINFIKMLEDEGHEYVVFSFDDGSFDNSKIELKNHYSVKMNRLLVRVLMKLRIMKIYKIALFYKTIKRFINLKYLKFDAVIGFDDVGYLVGRIFCRNSIYYSLEISRNILNSLIFKFLKPKLLIIQTEERKDYLISQNVFVETIYIQNCPIKIYDTPINKVYNNTLIYFGNVIKSHGVEECIKALEILNDHILVIKGIGYNQYIDYLMDKYRDLIKKERLVFDFNYISQEQIHDYLSKFSIGFCFYDVGFKKRKNFNYISSPSGKMFAYFSSGIPVIGVNFIGLKPVTDFSAGILLDELNAENIKAAVESIKNNYEYYLDNVKKAAEYFDYKRMFLVNKEKILEVRCLR